MASTNEEVRPPGALALAFAATFSTREGDRLATGDGLLGWLRREGLAPDHPEDAARLAAPSEMRMLLHEAHALRSAVGVLLRATAAGRIPPEPVVFAIDRVLAAGLQSRRLEHAGGALRQVEREEPRGTLGRLAPIARSAADLVTTVDPTRLRRCAAPDCATWFVDTSRGGRRRWCSMERCGNRHKAARHRRRRAPGH